MNSLGRLFRVSIYGESHGDGVGVLIDGCPAGIAITKAEIETALAQRRPGAIGTTPRIEQDEFAILSGVYKDKTSGAPINVFIKNENKKSADYDFTRATPRPGHCDLTNRMKYFDYNDPRGGGASSGRLTAALVVAGVFANKVLGDFISIKSELVKVGDSDNIEEKIFETAKERDSIGGIIETRINGIESGLGEPYFDSIESNIARAIFSIPGIIGVEFGAGFQGAKLKGSEFNDRYIDSNATKSSNNSGGINGGISNGDEIVFRVAVKPTSSIARAQETFNFVENKLATLETPGRHDVCFARRVPIVASSVAALVLADFFLIRLSQKEYNNYANSRY
jgi:chorismate synthase